MSRIPNPPPTPPLSDAEPDGDEPQNHVLQGLVRVTGKGALTSGIAGGLSSIALGPMGGLLGGLVGVIYGSVMAGTEGIRESYQPDGWGAPPVNLNNENTIPQRTQSERKFGIQNRGFPHGLPSQRRKNNRKSRASQQVPPEIQTQTPSPSQSPPRDRGRERRRDLEIPPTTPKKRISSSPGPNPERLSSRPQRLAKPRSRNNLNSNSAASTPTIMPKPEDGKTLSGLDLSPAPLRIKKNMPQQKDGDDEGKSDVTTSRDKRKRPRKRRSANAGQKGSVVGDDDDDDGEESSRAETSMDERKKLSIIEKYVDG